MKFIRLAFAALVVCDLTACATDYMAQQRKEKAVQVAASLQSGAYFEAYETAKPYIGNTLSDRSDFLTLFKKSPGFPDGLRGGLKKRIADMHVELDLATAEGDLAVVEGAALLPPDEIQSLRTLLSSSLKEEVAAGTFKTMFGRVTTQYPAVLEGDGLTHVMDATVDDLINSGTASTSGRRKYVTALFDAARSPAGANYRSRLESALPRMHLLMDELREDVAPIFPKFAEAAIASRTKRVALKTNPSRRLIEVDVGALIAKDPEVQVTTSDAAPFTVEIDELEYREQENGPSTRTVTVGYYEADIMYAVLFMPKNASFLFDVAEREQHIDWGYEIKVKGPKGERSRIVRDNQSNSSHQCVNARIVNVFGGVSSPSGWPNSQTASFCSGNIQPKTLQEVRGEVMHKVADAVAELLALAQ